MIFPNVLAELGSSTNSARVRIKHSRKGKFSRREFDPPVLLFAPRVLPDREQDRVPDIE